MKDEPCDKAICWVARYYAHVIQEDSVIICEAFIAIPFFSKTFTAILFFLLPDY